MNLCTATVLLDWQPDGRCMHLLPTTLHPLHACYRKICPGPCKMCPSPCKICSCPCKICPCPCKICSCAHPVDCPAGNTSTDQQIAAMNLTWNSPNGSTLIPSMCPLWHDKGNSAAGYGPIFAFPAAQLAVGCSSAETSYTCSHSSATSTGLVIRDFLSTSQVDSEGRPESLLQVYVLMRDMLGQNMTAGELACLRWVCAVHADPLSSGVMFVTESEARRGVSSR